MRLCLKNQNQNKRCLAVYQVAPSKTWWTMATAVIGEELGVWASLDVLPGSPGFGPEF